MGCEGCSFRGATFTKDDMIGSITESNEKLRTSDWLNTYHSLEDEQGLVEVRFKNTRKDFYYNNKEIPLAKGDVVAVESQFGHDIGTVSLTGKLAFLQVKRRNLSTDRESLKKIFRKATRNDLKNYREAMELEKPTLIRSRQIINELGLEMKLGDIEYQGDKSKAIFYYIAEGRVDFRELIKLLAKEFRIRVEMKQIGARQEAGRIGGIGSCGRELCCSSWKTNFQSVSLNAAKMQDLPANAQKLAGQCGKLKCCLMYELDNYLEARDQLPKALLELETPNGIAYHHKTDLLKRLMYYSYSLESAENLIPLTVDKVKEIINKNKRGIKVDISPEIEISANVSDAFEYTATADAINRFDRQKNTNKNNKKNKRR